MSDDLDAIDREIAERLGWRVANKTPHLVEVPGSSWQVWRPTRSWQAMGELVEEMRRRGWWWELDAVEGGRWAAKCQREIEDPLYHGHDAGTLPEAVARAALEALGSEAT